MDSLAEVVSRKQNPDNLLINSLDFLWLELTNRCNLQCSHCYSNSSPYEPECDHLELKDWMKLLNEAHELGCRKVQFIGGEPLLYSGLPDLIREARRLNYNIIEVFSNGTRLTEKMAQLFADNGVMLATSFYSDDACAHDSITGLRGSHQRTIQGLKRAITAGVRTRVGIIAMPENESAMESTAAFLRTLGIDDIQVDRVRGFGRGESLAVCKNPKDELCGGCWRGSLAVNSAGEVSPCIFSHFHNVGHASDGMAKILDNPALHIFREEIRSVDEARSSLAFNTNESADQSCVPYYCSPKYWCEPSKGPNI